MNYDHNKKFGLLKFHLGYGNCYLNSPKGYSQTIINAQTESTSSLRHYSSSLVSMLSAGLLQGPETKCVNKCNKKEIKDPKQEDHKGPMSLTLTWFY